MKKTRVFIFLAVIQLHLHALELRLPATRIDVAEGFSGNHIMCMHKDRNGFMWFGSDNGLYRYDGNKMVNLQNMEGVTGQLSETYINDIAEDTSGILWIQTKTVLHRFDMNTGVLQKYATVGCAGSYEFVPGNNISVAGDGTVWQTCTKNQTIRCVSGRDSISAEIQMTSCVSDTLLRQILTDRTECYMVGMTEARILKKSTDGKLTAVFDHSGILKKGASVFCLPDLCVSGNGRFIVFGVNQQDFLSYDNQTLQMQLLRSPFGDRWLGTTELEFDRNNICWMGLHCEMPKRNVIATLNPLTNEIHRLDTVITEWADARMHCFLPDEQNLFWMGTDRGVVKMHVTSLAFSNYLHRNFSNSSDYEFSARGLFQMNDSVLLASTYAGNFRLNLRTGSSTAISDAVMRIAYGFWKGADGRIRLIDDTKGIWYYEPAANRYSLERSTNVAFRSLLKDETETEWLGGCGAIYRWAKGEKEPKNITGLLSGAALNDVCIKCMLQVSDSELLLGTPAGLYRLNINNYHLSPLHRYWGEQNMGAPEVNQLYMPEPDQLWMATTKGLQHLNFATGELEFFGRNEGMANTTVVSILPDQEGNLWMGTYNGLSCFIIKEKKFRNFMVADGLPHSEFNFGSSLKLNDGRLMFGTLNGLVAFYPKEVLTGNTGLILSPVVTRLSVYDGKKKEFIATETGSAIPEKIELSPFNRSMELDVSLLNYSDPAKHEFRYYLQGFDDTWISNGVKRTIRYTSLPAGSYHLHVQALDERGQWSKELVIPVIVHEIFYRQAWFWLLCFVILSGLGYLAYRIRMAQLKKLHNMRMSIAADLHDEVGSMLTGIAFQAELAQEGSNSAQTGALEKVTGSLQGAIEKMRDVIWTVDAQNDNWGNLLTRMEDHLFETFSSTTTRYKFNTTGLNPKKEINSALRQNLFLIFKEAVNNIIKHSNPSEVLVFIGNTDQGFEMRISDNGTVSEAKFASGGNGLNNMRKRAQALQAEVEIDFSRGCEIILRRNKPL